MDRSRPSVGARRVSRRKRRAAGHPSFASRTDAAKNPKKAGAKGGGGDDKEEEEEEEDDVEPEPLTPEQLYVAEKEMEEELAKLVGMESVKVNMRKLCKQLSLDIKRRSEGQKVLDSIRHMMFTGNPGCVPPLRRRPRRARAGAVRAG